VSKNPEQEDIEREKRKQQQSALDEMAAMLASAIRSEPSTDAITATLVASGSQPLQQYNVPLDVITRVSQQQAQQVVEKNMIPIIEQTAKTTVQEHEKEEKARENAPIEKAKRGGSQIFWIIVAFVLGLVFTYMLRGLGIQFP
jgi:CHASE3 domain sensor protein